MTAKDAPDSLRQNRAAAWTASLLGLLMIGTTAPFTLAMWDEGVDPTEWVVAWDAQTAGAPQTASIAAVGQTDEAALNVTGIPAALLVEVSCTDQPLPGVGVPAQMEVVLFEGATELERRTGTCAELEQEPWNLTLAPHPEITASGLEEEDAQEDLDGQVADQQRAAEYRLTLTASRDAPLPLPGTPQGSFSADARLSALVWEATLGDREGPEVVR